MLSIRSLFRGQTMLKAVPLVGLLLAVTLFATEQKDTSRVAQNTPQAVSDSVDWNGGILYGDGFAYYLHADTGWVMDHSLEGPFDAISVFRLPRFEPMESPVYITSVIWHRDSGMTIQEVAKQYGARFASDFTSAQITACSSLVTAVGDSALVMQFVADGESVYERVAFCDAERIVVGIMLWSRYRGNFFESLPAFAATVKSYYCLTRRVRIEGQEPPPAYPGDSA